MSDEEESAWPRRWLITSEDDDEAAETAMLVDYLRWRVYVAEISDRHAVQLLLEFSDGALDRRGAAEMLGFGEHTWKAA